MRSASVAVVVLAVGLLSGDRIASGDEFDAPEQGPDLPLAERVNPAIDRGIAFLRGRQLRDGSWGPCLSSGVSYDGRTTARECCPTGPTAFALFTLAKCGASREDPALRKALTWLRGQDRRSRTWTTYEAAAFVLALTALYEGEEPLEPTIRHQRPPSGSRFPLRDWRLLHEVLTSLRARQTLSGGWGYYAGEVYADVSATQFALLALREAARAGYPIRSAVPLAWTDSLRFLRDRQAEDGSFAYDDEEGWSSGMTAAGLASLLISREQLLLADQPVPEGVDARITSAFDSLGRSFRCSVNRSGNEDGVGAYHYCHLYAVERCGALGKRHRIGDHDWYEYGAEFLLAKQGEDGGWRDATCMGPVDTLGTCFALLFLRRATPPAVVTPSGD